jgi:hypothetical protein
MFQFPADLSDLPADRYVFADNYNFDLRKSAQSAGKIFFIPVFKTDVTFRRNGLTKNT